MSTGTGPSEPRRDQEAADEQTFADVLNAFSFGGGRRRRGSSGTRGGPQDAVNREAEESSPPAVESSGREAGNPAHEATAAFAEGPDVVRAYVWTGGRTRSHHHFEVETLVTTATAPSLVPETATQWDRAVLDMCREPRSVAEVAALLAVPLGVAKVLLGDMANRGVIVVHGTTTGVGQAPSRLVMERVLMGLRQL